MSLIYESVQMQQKYEVPVQKYTSSFPWAKKEEHEKIAKYIH